MHVVPLGINLEGHNPEAASRARSGPFTVGFFARVAPEKGLHTLAEAYLKLRRETGPGGSRLEAAGYLAPEHREYLRAIKQRMEDAGAHGEFHYRGVLDREQKIAFLQALNVLTVPSTYDEPKGIFLMEAMANGVPVVQPRRGAFPEILDKTGGGILVEPDDAGSLAEGLLSLWKDPARRTMLGTQGAQGVAAYYSDERMAAAALEVYEKIAAGETRA
jgi:glycosyltransferase involved in cell wall biosynthesis